MADHSTSSTRLRAWATVRGDDLEHLVLRLAHLVRQMDRRGRDEGVDARAGPRGARLRRRGRCRPRWRAPGRRRSRSSRCLAMRQTASKSPFEAMGKPASMMSTPMASSSSATSSFSSRVMVAPGHCSPSRRVVSKIRTRSLEAAGYWIAVISLVLLGGAGLGIDHSAQGWFLLSEPLSAQAPTPSRPSGATKEKEAKEARASRPRKRSSSSMRCGSR